MHRCADLASQFAPASPGDRRLVAVDGPGGSGKSTFARRLARELTHLGQTVAVVPVDDFYRPASEEGPEPEGLFDLARLEREVLDPYLAGEPTSYRAFDWNAGSVSREVRRVGSPPILIVEGVFAASPLLGGHHSFGAWVEASRSLRLSRGLARDGEAARGTWTELWMPREDRYFDQTRPDLRADLVVDGGRPGPAGTFWRREKPGRTIEESGPR